MNRVALASSFFSGSILSGLFVYSQMPTKYVGCVEIQFDGIERSSGFLSKVYSSVSFSRKKDAMDWANNQEIPKLKDMQGYCDPVAITNRSFVDGKFLDFSLGKEYKALDLTDHWRPYGHLQHQ